MPEPNLAVNLGGLVMANPVTVASGTFGYGEEYAPLLEVSRLGALTLKGLTLAPRPGNPPPRLVETPAGLLNSIGLENPGLVHFLAWIMPRVRQYGVPVIVNISGNTPEEYALLARGLNGAPGVSALEVNISCPNVHAGGMLFGADPALAAEAVAAVRETTKLPVLAKLTPNVTDVVAIARAVAQAGADGLSLINTLLGMAIDVDRRQPVLGNITGGLSGPAIRPVAVRVVWQVAQEVDLPILGMGGITNARDALEFILAGASAVAVGTASFAHPRTALDVVQGLEDYLRREGIGNINELVGAAWKGAAS